MEEKPCKKGNYMEDQLSALPDEIIIAILSLLTMKEAARTSVLSLKWKNLWKFFTGSLNFDASKTKVRMRQKIETMSHETERTKYISWVNKVLNLHQGQNIEEFRVCFDLDKNFACVVDRWINFAKEKRVRKLELDLRGYFDYSQFEDSCTFPLSPFGVLSFNTLTSLCLKSVDLTEDVLAHFLSNCPLIEELSLMHSQSLVNLKIDGPLKLKYLELSYCFSLQNLEISATNLISFKYHGPYLINNALKNVPLLSEVSIGGIYCRDLVCLTFYHFSGVLSQLETLVLDLDSLVQRSHLIPKIFPEFCNLKQLELQVVAYKDQSILCLTSLIDASPCLYKFVVKLRYGGCPERIQEHPNVEFTCLGEKPREGTRGLHECLKVVEIVGWVGYRTDTELAVYLLENAVLLDKITVVSRHPYYIGSWDLNDPIGEGNDAARERAKQLETKLPPGAELVIL